MSSATELAPLEERTRDAQEKTNESQQDVSQSIAGFGLAGDEVQGESAGSRLTGRFAMREGALTVTADALVLESRKGPYSRTPIEDLANMELSNGAWYEFPRDWIIWLEVRGRTVSRPLRFASRRERDAAHRVLRLAMAR